MAPLPPGFLRKSLLPCAALALLAAGIGGCARLPWQRQDIASTAVAEEQRLWWEQNKQRAQYVPGKGYYVEQVGYFDAEGKPLGGQPSQTEPQPPVATAAPPPAEKDDKPFEWGDFSPSKITRTTKQWYYGKPSEQEARKAFREGEELFQSRDYDGAKTKFDLAATRWPDSTLEEDAMFMQAECDFFSDRYAKADEAYDYLLKKYPSTEYLSKISRRRYAVAQYWQALHSQEPHWAFTPNMTDKKRPLFDTRGRAIKAYEAVLQTDPRGELSDDAVMAVADAYFNIRYFDDADFRYKMLITDYPQSRYQFQAHQQSLKCKLLKYQGAEYEGAPLDEAEELIEQMFLQFPDKLRDEKEREALLTARKEVRAQKALRDFSLAEYYARGSHYRAARQYYTEVIQEYPNSSFAEQARTRLAEYKDKPEVSSHPLEFMTRWLPGRTITDGERIVRDPEVTSAKRRY
ncbi:MAG: outer membrane protein assembly factor BamD [Pirellulales bacterium]